MRSTGVRGTTSRKTSGLAARAERDEPDASGDGKAGRPRLDRVLFFGGDPDVADLQDIATRGQATALPEQETSGDNQDDPGDYGEAHGQILVIC